MNKNEHNHVHGVKTCAEKEHHSHHNHNHHFHHHHSHQHSADENILVAFFLNLFFVFVELAGGFLTNSFAILSDAVHDFGDCVAIGFAYLMEKYSNKTPDEKYTYGYRRYSLLSAIITSLILVIGSIFILIGSVTRFNEQGEISGLGMLIIAVFGVVVNGIAVVKTRKGTGANERAISLHLLEDVLGWIAVLVGSLLIYLFKWYFIDSLLSVIIAGFLLFESSKNIKEIFVILLEKTPETVDVKHFRESIQSVECVENTHHIHVWSLDGEKTMATIHIRLCENATIEQYERVKTEVERISAEHGIDHMTVQIDFKNEKCCNECDL